MKISVKIWNKGEMGGGKKWNYNYWKKKKKKKKSVRTSYRHTEIQTWYWIVMYIIRISVCVIDRCTSIYCENTCIHIYSRMYIIRTWNCLLVIYKKQKTDIRHPLLKIRVYLIKIWKNLYTSSASENMNVHHGDMKIGYIVQMCVYAHTNTDALHTDVCDG